jgi:hypothetical protein
MYVHGALIRSSLIPTVLVKRVHWLRARAQSHRWREEFTLVQYEMTWVVRFFKHMSSTWSRRQGNVLNLLDLLSSATAGGARDSDVTWARGAAAYAQRQITRWSQFAGHAENTFRATHPGFTLTHPGCENL